MKKSRIFAGLSVVALSLAGVGVANAAPNPSAECTAARISLQNDNQSLKDLVAKRNEAYRQLQIQDKITTSAKAEVARLQKIYDANPIAKNLENLKAAQEVAKQAQRELVHRQETLTKAAGAVDTAGAKVTDDKALVLKVCNTQPLVVKNDSYTVNNRDVLNVNVLANDSGRNVKVISDTSSGITVASNGSFAYTGNCNDVSFDYTARDFFGSEAVGHVSIDGRCDATPIPPVVNNTVVNNPPPAPATSDAAPSTIIYSTPGTPPTAGESMVESNLPVTH